MDESKLFLAVTNIWRMAYDYANADVKEASNLWLEDLSFCNPNPTRKQTKSGLYIELVDGKPACLWTPWGEWDCWGDGAGNWNHNMIRFLARLGASKYLPSKNLRRFYRNSLGSIFSIKKVDDTTLPKSIMYLSSNEFKHPEDVLNSWKSLKDCYEKMQEAWTVG
jgi:hypothetical protein